MDSMVELISVGAPAAVCVAIVAWAGIVVRRAVRAPGTDAADE
jgi:hypothetical protein